MKPVRATSRIRSGRFFLAAALLTLGACATAGAQRNASVSASATITFRAVVSPMDKIGTGASQVSSILRDLDTMETPPDEGAWITASLDNRFFFPPRQGVVESEPSAYKSTPLSFKIEDMYCNHSRGVAAILGSDGNLYIRTPQADDQHPSEWGGIESGSSILLVVSVVD
ncbi:MAG: hypothetical protein HY707_09570 [Ignavibacteriae bacterium]|nr:hypothetical protein [Ignavibacteriota bacterium]